MVRITSAFLASIVAAVLGCNQANNSKPPDAAPPVAKTETPDPGKPAPSLPSRPSLSADELKQAQATPVAVASASFAALQRHDLETFAALFHPEELERFKSFAIKVSNYNEPDPEVEQLRNLLAPFDSQESIAAAGGADLMAAFVNNSLLGIPGVEDILAESELELLGEIAESPDKVHVITRTFLPRPQPLGCQQRDGRWYQLLNNETMSMIAGFERKEHFRKKNVSVESILQGASMDKIDVIGYVNDGEDTAQVLCRVHGQIDDYDFAVLGCYPVHNDEPAWKHLDNQDETNLADALRAKWNRLDSERGR